MKRLVILSLMVLLLSSCSNKEEKIATVQSIDCATMKEKLVDQAYLVDVRSKEEYALSSLDYAINIPIDQIENKISDIVNDKTKPIIVFCRSGSRSKQAANKLIELGYQEVYDLGSINNCSM